MNIGEILIWESTNALLLIPVVIGLVMLVRWMLRRPVFTDKDWLFLARKFHERHDMAVHDEIYWLARELIKLDEPWMFRP